jgi:hypothetical protein
MKKSTQKLVLALTIVTALNFVSCGKYEDGPNFSLRTKKARLSGEWEIVRIGNVNFPSEGYSIEMDFSKDGDLEFTYSYFTYSYTERGEWEFSGDKEDLLLTFGNETQKFEILRLTNEELWMESIDGGSVEEWRLEKK